MNFLTKAAIATGIVISGVSFSAANASAALISGFGDPITAIPGGDVIDFDTTTAGNYSSLTFGNVTVTGVNGVLRTSSTYAGQYNTRGTKYLDNNAGSTNQIRFDFGSVVNKFAFNFGASDNIWELNAFDAGGGLLDSTSIATVNASNAGEYFGLSASGISYATLTKLGAGSDWIFVDNFTSTSANTQAVPEPFTMLGSLTAFGYAANAKRKSKLAQSKAKKLDKAA